jgi:FMN reductase
VSLSSDILQPDDVPREVVALVGNPVSGSRTSTVAEVIAEVLAQGLAGPGRSTPTVIELADLQVGPGPEFESRAATLRETVADADVLVVATPVYKAGYTGLLKLFLDGLEHTALESTVVIPVVLAASSAHGAIADLQLRLVLQAVGALLPVPSFVLEEHHLDDLPQYVDAWQHRFGAAVAAVAGTLRPREEVVAR